MRPEDSRGWASESTASCTSVWPVPLFDYLLSIECPMPISSYIRSDRIKPLTLHSSNPMGKLVINPLILQYDS